MSKLVHKRAYEIIDLYLGDYRREIYGRALAGQVSMSQKGIANILRALASDSILLSRKQGNMCYYSLNTANTEMRDYMTAAEIERKIGFMAKHRKIAHLFKDDGRIIGLFGSYADGSEKEDSDIDLFLIGKRRPKEYDLTGQELGLSISIKYFSRRQFSELLRKRNNLCAEIVRNHVILFGAEGFVRTLWRDFYGFH